VGGGGGGGLAGGRNGALVTHVKIVGNAVDEDFQTGRTKAPVFTCENPQSVNLLVDSRSRLNLELNKNPFDFRVTINSNLYRSRFVKVRKVIVPKIPNINPNNNEFCVTAASSIPPFLALVYKVTIPTGYYTTSTFANVLAALLSAVVAEGTIAFIVTFNPINKTFNISTSNASLNNLFFISSNCSFIRRGANMVPFQAYDENDSLNYNLSTVGAFSFNSSMACMLYSRYLFLASEAFNTFSYAVSRTSDEKITDDIIAVADISSTYFAEDWDVGRPFAGLCRQVETPESPYISLRNPQRNLNALADFYVLDEFGTNLGAAFDLGHDYPDNSASGIAFWMEITF
jgi:hypothetical protein